MRKKPKVQKSARPSRPQTASMPTSKAPARQRAVATERHGEVTASTAILRTSTGGAMITRLGRGERIIIKGKDAPWVKVTANGLAGVLSQRRFKVIVTPSEGRALKRKLRSGPVAIPPEAGAGDIKVVGTNLVGPNGIVFGKTYKLGLFNVGTTALDAFFDEDPEAFLDVAPSIQRVMRAVSANEGKIEAINTWDNAILSCSIYQWTVSAGADAGELPYALSVLKARAPQAFATYFGSYGLDVTAPQPKPFAVGRGFFKLNGTLLNTEALKAPLRSHLWAYRFWRAAHDREVRRAYVRVAIDRIPIFYEAPIAKFGGRPLSDFVTSEEGVAHLLDQHVNRPGHVPNTIIAAIDAVVAATGKTNPSIWSDAEERETIARYLKLREATSMTDPAIRAQRIKVCVETGSLSDRRGSFRAEAAP